MATLAKNARKNLRRRTLSALAVLAVVLLLTGCGSSFAAKTDEATRLADVLDLKPGMRVADVGAGGGEWSEKLAPFIEADGRIYTTEIKDDEIKKIRKRIEKAENWNDDEERYCVVFRR